MWSWFLRPQREGLLNQPFPKGWEAHLQRNVAHYPMLSEEQQARLKAETQVLVGQKYWEGCNGLGITDEMKVTIAAQASLMLLGLPDDSFRRVLSILVYPTSFTTPKEEWEANDPSWAMAGQAVYRGPVILAWDSVLSEGRDPSIGRNLVIHEFAHQLDFLDGYANGTPDLISPDEAKRWHDVMTTEFSFLRRAVDGGHGTFLGEYAASNETEFFSVVSERFFTVPAQLRHYHQNLYDLLAEFYGVEPMKWFARKKTNNQAG